MQRVVFDDDVYRRIKINIRKYRLMRNITSAELAEMIDVSHEFMRQVQSESDRHNCSFETLYKICVALNIKIDDLLQENKRESIY